MKILIDARELKTTSGRYVERLIFYLQKIDNANKYIILVKSSEFDLLELTNPNFVKIKCPYKEFTFSEQFGLLRQIRSLNVDLVHFTFPQQPILYKGNTVTTIHDLTTLRFINPAKNIFYFKIKQRIFSTVIKKAVKKASNVIVPSEFVKNDLTSFSKIDPRKINVTFESADPITEAAEPVLEIDGKKFLMYIGRPNPHKNLDRLIDAFSNVQVRNPELYLALAGKKDSNYLELEKKVKENKVKNVFFLGFVSEGQLRWLYENCQAYIFPSLSEGFGLPGLEAMINGAPVISSNATCLPEVYGDAAVYFDPLNIQDMTDKIIDLISSPKKHDDLVLKGSQQVKKYSWLNMAKQTLEIYNNSLKS